MFGTNNRNMSPKTINKGHSKALTGLNNFKSRQSSNGTYAKNKFNVIKLKICDSVIDITNKIIKYILAK